MFFCVPGFIYQYPSWNLYFCVHSWLFVFHDVLAVEVCFPRVSVWLRILFDFLVWAENFPWADRDVSWKDNEKLEQVILCLIVLRILYGMPVKIPVLHRGFSWNVTLKDEIVRFLYHISLLNPSECFRQRLGEVNLLHTFLLNFTNCANSNARWPK